VFLDALLIRLVVLPVVLRITGHLAWHRPAWLDKVLPAAGFTH
jgi:RND superfamily putative drug exporter